MNKTLFKIREKIWTVLEQSVVSANGHINDYYLKKEIDLLEDNNFDKEIFEHYIRSFKAEEDRRETVEKKSSLFIGTMSITTSVLIGIISILSKTTDCNLFSALTILSLIILSLYLSMTIWFSIKTLERSKYHTFHMISFIKMRNGKRTFKSIMTEAIMGLNHNQWVTNGKVNNMMMAQEFFKKAIVTVVVLLILILLNILQFDFATLFKNTTIYLNSLNIDGLIILSLFVLAITSFVVSIIALRKCRHAKRQS